MSQTTSQKSAQAALDDHAALAVMAAAYVELEGFSFVFAEGSIEKEVDDAFHIVTEHLAAVSLPLCEGDD